MEPADVVIVGGGPAGAAAGITLAGRGARVTLVDRSRFPRKKVCGGLLTQRSLKLAIDLLGGDLPSTVPMTSTGRVKLYDGGQCLNSVEMGTPMHGVDRIDFDFAMVEAASRAGCRILEKCRVRSLSVDRQTLEIGGEKLPYDFLIAADGVNSQVRRMLGRPLDATGIATAYQTHIPLEEASELGLTGCHCVYLGHVDYGWGWSFPKRGHVTVGLAGLGLDGRRLKEVFLGFLEDLGFNWRVSGARLEGAFLPFGAFDRQPCARRVLFAGDAAGFADPITGEGVLHAMLSGRAAAHSILDCPARAEETYVRSLKTTVMNRMNQARLLRPFFFSRILKPVSKKIIAAREENLRRFMEAAAGEASYAECLAGSFLPWR